MARFFRDLNDVKGHLENELYKARTRFEVERQILFDLKIGAGTGVVSQRDTMTRIGRAQGKELAYKDAIDAINEIAEEGLDQYTKKEES